jgi:hypothetical protein
MRTGRRFAIGAGTVAIVIVMVFMINHGREIEARWLLMGLERVRTREEASASLNRLAVACAHPPTARLVTGLLGPGRQYATFWVFYKVIRDRPEGPGLLLGALIDRFNRDPDLAARWRQFVVWWGYEDPNILGDINFPTWDSKQRPTQPFPDWQGPIPDLDPDRG